MKMRNTAGEAWTLNELLSACSVSTQSTSSTIISEIELDTPVSEFSSYTVNSTNSTDFFSIKSRFTDESNKCTNEIDDIELDLENADNDDLEKINDHFPEVKIDDWFEKSFFFPVFKRSVKSDMPDIYTTTYLLPRQMHMIVSGNKEGAFFKRALERPYTL